MELSDFLLARIAEDEAEIAAGYDFAVLDSSGWMGHAATWGKERALAECEAKRRIVTEVYPDLDRDNDALNYEFGAANADPEDLLRLLARPYATHPDYDEAWRP